MCTRSIIVRLLQWYTISEDILCHNDNIMKILDLERTIRLKDKIAIVQLGEHTVTDRI